jgi:hypothetical protein
LTITPVEKSRTNWLSITVDMCEEKTKAGNKHPVCTLPRRKKEEDNAFSKG